MWRTDGQTDATSRAAHWNDSEEELSKTQDWRRYVPNFEKKRQAGLWHCDALTLWLATRRRGPLFTQAWRVLTNYSHGSWVMSTDTRGQASLTTDTCQPAPLYSTSNPSCTTVSWLAALASYCYVIRICNCFINLLSNVRRHERDSHGKNWCVSYLLLCDFTDACNYSCSVTCCRPTVG